MNLRAYVAAVLLFLSLGAIAQNELDAYRHSQSTITGSARMQAMGGAFSAAGADIGITPINPAGLGLMRGSSFFISPSYSFGRVDGTFINQSGQGNSNYFGIPNWGVAFTTVSYYEGEEEKKRRSSVKSYSFAFGHNQVENYHKNTVVSGAFNGFSSITNMFAEMAAGQNFFDLLNSASYPGLALQSFMIEVIADRPDSLDYYGAGMRGNLNQTVQIEESGKRNEWYIGMGANFNEKFMLGGSVSFERLRYEQNFTFTEEDVNESYEFYDPEENNGFPLELPWQSLTFNEEFSTEGVGVSATAGMIYRPVDAIRIALSAETPTLFTLTDIFDNVFTSVIESEDQTGREITEEIVAAPENAGTFDYNLVTPFRATGGLMILLNKAGFLTADVEYLNYGSARLSSVATNVSSPNFYSFTNENAAIRQDYTSAINVRVGGEFRYDIFRLRLGAALLGSGLTEPLTEYVDDQDFETVRSIDNRRLILTGGAGIRQRNFFVDVSLVNLQQEDKLTPYTLSNPDAFQPTLVQNRRLFNIMASIGLNF